MQTFQTPASGLVHAPELVKASLSLLIVLQSTIDPLDNFLLMDR